MTGFDIMAEIRAQEKRQRQIDGYCNMVRSKHIQTYEDDLQPPRWLWWLLAVVAVVLFAWQGEVRW